MYVHPATRYIQEFLKIQNV